MQELSTRHFAFRLHLIKPWTTLRTGILAIASLMGLFVSLLAYVPLLTRFALR